MWVLVACRWSRPPGMRLLRRRVGTMRGSVGGLGWIISLIIGIVPLRSPGSMALMGLNRRQEDVVDQILATLKDKTFAGAFSAIITPSVISLCTTIASKLGEDPQSRTVATVLPESMPYTEPVPEGVTIAYCNATVEITPPENNKLVKQFGWKPKPNTIEKDVWVDWLSPALDTGLMKCKPDPEVVGSGLESVQAAVDKMCGGVSATKLVVEFS